ARRRVGTRAFSGRLASLARGRLQVGPTLSRLAVGLTLLAATAFTASAQQLPIPILKNVFPCGAGQGTSVEVEIGGANLDGTTKLYFSHPGLTAELISDPAKPPARFKVSAAADVPVGGYDVRSIGKLGISNPRTFSVSDYAEVNETEPNDAREKAQRVPLDSVINGRVNPSEDIDWFVFPAAKGQRVIIECQAWRIDSRLDGTLTLYNSEGKELATSQDENIRDQKRDPLIDFEVPADGDYYLRFTDFMYNGSPDNFYRLSLGTHPYVDFITPTGAKPGTTAEITFYGRNLPGGEKTDVKVNGRPLEKAVRQIAIPGEPDAVTSLHFSELLRPPTSRIDGMEVRIEGEKGVSNPKLLHFSDGPEQLETEPNNTIGEAQRVNLPCALTGQFVAAKDVDHFVFSAKKDEKFTIEVMSERIGSPADPDLEISESDGKIINGAQDTGENIGQLRFPTNTRDIVYQFTAPKTADFTLRLEHVYQQVQGGAQYQYRLQIQRDPPPDFRLVCTPTHDIHIDSHAVYQGGRQRLDVLVWRINGHDGPITVEARNLPAGVTAEPIVIGHGMKWGTLVVTAAPGAPVGEAEIEVIGTGERGEEKLVRKARGGVIVWDTVNTAAISRLTRSIMLAVREKTPFAVTASPAEMVIKPGDPINVTVTATRRADMPSAIQLNGAGIELPTGLTIPTTTINPGQAEAKLVVTTTDKLKEGVYSFIINAEAQVPGEGDKKIRCIYPSNPLKITVEAKAGK
ncbi:MAG: hypothetical protein QOE70_710, partial [Chthoniobacter sp.]|nr:hypothetical protein [Chthoniobacter sp.]